jgi:hypothetical protein
MFLAVNSAQELFLDTQSDAITELKAEAPAEGGEKPKEGKGEGAPEEEADKLDVKKEAKEALKDLKERAKGAYDYI